MKKILFTIILLSFNLLFSQELIKTTTDEFTGSIEISTSWEVLFRKGMTPSVCKYRFNNVDGKLRLEVRLVVNGGEVFAVDETMAISFLMDNKEVVEFYPNGVFIAKKGGASDGFIGSSRWGATIYYQPSSNEAFNLLSIGTVKKVRLHTDIGYVEDKLKSKEQETLSRSISLIL